MKPFNLKEFRQQQREQAKAIGREYDATTPMPHVDKNRFITFVPPPQRQYVRFPIFTFKE